MHTNRTVKTVVAVLCAILALPTAVAQFTTASLSGIVKDTSGSLVPAARVTVTNKDTGFTRSDNTSVDGAFLLCSRQTA